MTDVYESHQKKIGYRLVNIATVDSGGDLVLFRRQNNTFLFSIDIAVAKTNSSAIILVSTRTIQDNVYGKDDKHGRALGLAHSKNIVAFPRGLPIKKKNGTLLGAIVISWTTRGKNEQYANATLLAVNEYV